MTNDHRQLKTTAASESKVTVQFPRERSKVPIGFALAFAVAMIGVTTDSIRAQTAYPHGSRVIGVEHNYISHDGSADPGSVRDNKIGKCVDALEASKIASNPDLKDNFFIRTELIPGDDHEIDLFTLTARVPTCGPGEYFYRHIEVKKFATNSAVICHSTSSCTYATEDKSSVFIPRHLTLDVDVFSDYSLKPPPRGEQTAAQVAPATDLVCTF